jgi:hypothetical protein
VLRLGGISSDGDEDHVTEQGSSVPTLRQLRNASPRRRRQAAAALAAAALVAAVLLAVLTSGGPTTPPHHATPAPAPGIPAQPPPAAEQFGANVGRLFNDRSYTPAQIGAQLAALRQTGATLARSDALWEATEPTPPVGGTHRYDWSFDDSIAASLAAHGLRWLPIIDYSAPWAQSIPGSDHSPPSSAADYAAYAAALAGRYGPGGSFWSAHPGLPQEPIDTYEIWNEPDNSAFWTPSPDAAGYATLYLRARDAITAVQPGARVIVGGLTHPTAFIAAMLAASPTLRGHLDGVAVHPYGANPLAVLAGVRAARLALDSLGIGSVPLYITEFGWTTHPPGALDYLPERLRPGYIERSLAALGHLDCGVAAVLLYAWVTPERDRANPEDWFGIHPPDGAPSPDTAAFAEGLRAAASPGSPISLCAGG